MCTQFAPSESSEEKIRLGISSCLLGQNVRYDGGHKLDRFLTDTLGRYVEYVPVCPEVEIGLPVPREAMRQIGDPEHPRLVTIRTGLDLTERMEEWAGVRVEELSTEELCGFIFKSRSPSSGMERVKVYDAAGMPHMSGVGLFARAFMERFPLLPVEEEGRLHDPKLRENFIESIFTLRRWRRLMNSDRRTRGGLIEFHTDHKLLILSHNQEIYRRMGRLVADVKDLSLDQALEQYQQLLLKAMQLRTTLKKHVNVLMHLMGYFKKDLSGDEKQELLGIIQEFQSGHLPLIVPITLINHYVRKYDQPYLKRQYYLNPHPLELQLRNHS